MALHQRKIPTFLTVGIFRHNQFYFRRLGQFFRPALAGIRHFYLQNASSAKLLSSIGISHHTICGDTRYDRVVAIANTPAEELFWIKQFKGKEPVMVLGSTWQSDFKKLHSFITDFHSKLKFIVVPHRPELGELTVWRNLPASVVLSEATEANLPDARILIVDRMGLLSRLYRYAELSYVGGAFRGALHNTLEAAVYGIPVFFGDHQANSKFLEAKGLVDSGGGFTFEKATQLSSQVAFLLENKEAYAQAANASRTFVKRHTGATEKVVAGLKPHLQ